MGKPLEMIKVNERMVENFSAACELVNQSQMERFSVIYIRFISSIFWTILMLGAGFTFFVVYRVDQPTMAWGALIGCGVCSAIEMILGSVRLRRRLRHNALIQAAKQQVTAYDIFLMKLSQKIAECNRDIENFNKTYAKLEAMPSWQRSIVGTIREDIDASRQVYVEFLSSLSFFAPQNKRDDIVKMVNADTCNAFVSCLAALLKDI